MNDELPFEIAQTDTEDFSRFDERMTAVNCLFANTIGVNESTIEWCPNNEPPEQDEKLAWLWLINPSRGVELLPQCSEELSKLINAYISKTMESWFEYMAT